MARMKNGLPRYYEQRERDGGYTYTIWDRAASLPVLAICAGVDTPEILDAVLEALNAPVQAPLRWPPEKAIQAHENGAGTARGTGEVA